jgi:hypothetical protein
MDQIVFGIGEKGRQPKAKPIFSKLVFLQQADDRKS